MIRPLADRVAPPARWRERFNARVRDWAQRRFEQRLRAEWDDWRQSAAMEVKPRWFRRMSRPQRTQNFRSLVQVNFYRIPRQ